MANANMTWEGRGCSVYNYSATNVTCHTRARTRGEVTKRAAETLPGSRLATIHLQRRGAARRRHGAGKRRYEIGAGSHAWGGGRTTEMAGASLNFPNR